MFILVLTPSITVRPPARLTAANRELQPRRPKWPLSVTPEATTGAEG